MADLTQSESARLRTSPRTTSRSRPARPSTRRRSAAFRGARLLFRSGAQELRLRAGRSAAELYRARFDGATPQVRVRDGRVLVQYRGIPFDWRKRVATIGLNPSIPWSLEAVGGVNRVEADLREIDVRRFDVTGGSERIQAEARAAARRGPGPDRRRGEDHPARTAGGRADPPPGQGRRRTGRGRPPGLGSQSGDTAVESRGWSEPATGTRSRWSAARRPITVVERP